MTKPFYLFSIIHLISLTSFAQCPDLVHNTGKLAAKNTLITTCPGERSSEPVHYKRVKETGEVRYFLQLYTEKGALHPKKGATVIFKDGAKIEWTEAIVTSTYQEGHYTNYCEIILTEDLVEQFQEKEIALIKLSMQERELDSRQSQRAKHLINCVIFSDLPAVKSADVVRQQ